MIFLETRATFDTEKEIEKQTDIYTPILAEFLLTQQEAIFDLIGDGDTVSVTEPQITKAIKGTETLLKDIVSDMYMDVAIHFSTQFTLEKRSDDDDIKAIVEEYLRKESIILFEISNINSTTVDKIILQTTAAMEAGANANDLQQAIIDTGVFSPSRALMLSRTITGTAANLGQISGAINVGATDKTWSTATFEVRKSHQAMNNKTIPIDEFFIVGGHKAMFPLDNRLPPGERVNCRCTLLYGIDSELNYDDVTNKNIPDIEDGYKSKIPTKKEINAHMKDAKNTAEYKVLEKKAKDSKAEYEKAKKRFENADQNAVNNPDPSGQLPQEWKDASVELAKMKSEMTIATDALGQYESNAFNEMISPNKNGEINISIADKYLPKAKKKKKEQMDKVNDMKASAEAMFDESVLESMGDVNITYKKGSRAYYDSDTGEIHIGSFDKPDTFIHEFSHAVETSNPDIRSAAEAFRKKRVGDEELSSIYSNGDEEGWKDDFFDHYCGKKYEDGSTEIISMGVEKMYKDPQGFMEDDPEYFDFILKVMWGES